jgi:3-oxoacyl-[acyl-carrier-protein] synthase-1
MGVYFFGDHENEPEDEPLIDQFGFTALRISERLCEDWQRHTPALISGDVGSASALLHVALSANLLRRPENRTQTHLLLSSSDDSLRSALVLSL